MFISHTSFRNIFFSLISIMEEDENTKTRWEVLAKVMSRLKTPSLKTIGRPYKM